MSTIEEIEDAIRRLPMPELSMLRERFAKYDATVWDSQFESDVVAGRLDTLAEEAIADLRSGRCTDL